MTVTQKFIIEGMSCAACVTRIEKAVNSIDGVMGCVVSLLTNEMQVTFEEKVSPTDIINAVVQAGYKAQIFDKTQKSGAIGRLSGETKSMIKRLVPSAIIIIILMYVAMGHMIGLNLPTFLQGGEKAHLVALLQAALALSVLIINRKFFISGVKSFISLSPNMDALITLGSGASFLYSLFVTIKICISVANKNFATSQNSLHNLYYDGSAMIVVFITLGKMLESLSKGKTANAISALMALVPETATLLFDGKETVVSPDKIKVGDLFVVKAGERIPVDGVIIEGNVSVDESSLTGESMPVDKTEGCEVYTATVNLNGYFIARATKVGDDTTLSKIIELVKNVSVTKAPIAKLADKAAKVFVPTIIAISLVVLAIWLIIGGDFATALTHSVSVLVVSCPCALGLATPVAIMVGSGKGAKLGILYKNAEALENAGKLSAVVFDKTGTLTKGLANVTDVIPLNGFDIDLLKSLCLSIELKSSHPLGAAVVKAFNGYPAFEITDFEEIAGQGVIGKWDNKPVIGGNLKLLMSNDVEFGTIQNLLDELSVNGKTPLIFAVDNQIAGIVACADELKETSRTEIEYLTKCGIKVFMLTGDNKTVARAVGRKLGLNYDQIISEVLPDGKTDAVLKLKESHNVAMVGDGINDAPALTAANIGIAIGAGSNVAVQSADMVIVGSDVTEVSTGIELSKRVIKTVKENLFWAFIYNFIAIPIAAGALSGIGFYLSPGLASACMSLSSISVVLNALRINLFKSNLKPSEGKIKTDDTLVKKLPQNTVANSDDNENAEIGIQQTNNSNNIITYSGENAEKESSMITVLDVEGMMCHHCEMHVQNAVKSLSGVTEVTADHKTGKVTVTHLENFDLEEAKNAIKEQGYEVKN